MLPIHPQLMTSDTLSKGLLISLILSSISPFFVLRRRYFMERFMICNNIWNEQAFNQHFETDEKNYLKNILTMIFRT